MISIRNHYKKKFKGLFCCWCLNTKPFKNVPTGHKRNVKKLFKHWKQLNEINFLCFSTTILFFDIFVYIFDISFFFCQDSLSYHFFSLFFFKFMKRNKKEKYNISLEKKNSFKNSKVCKTKHKKFFVFIYFLFFFVLSKHKDIISIQRKRLR